MQSLDRNFCVKCGREGVPTFSGLCEQCYVEDNPLLQILAKDFVKVNYCPVCFKTAIREKWVNFSKDPTENIVEGVKKAVDAYFKAALGLTVNLDVIFPFEDLLSGKSFECSVDIHAKGSPIPEISPSEVHGSIKVRLTPKLCKSCIALKSEQIKSIIQVRAQDRTPTTKEVEAISSLMNEVIKKSNLAETSTMFVKTEEKRNGINFYIGNKEVAKTVGRRASETLVVKVTQTFKERGTDEKGKRTSSITICIRFPNFKKFDVISLKDGGLAQILESDREKITIFDLKSKKRKKISAKTLWDYEPTIALSFEKAPKFMIISKGQDSTQLMSLETYEVKEIPKGSLPKESKEGETIPCFHDLGIGTIIPLHKRQ